MTYTDKTLATVSESLGLLAGLYTTRINVIVSALFYLVQEQKDSSWDSYI